MTAPQIAGILVALILGATALGLLWRWQNGRIRRGGGELVLAWELPAGSELGTRATLLQFSSELCSPCVATRRVLSAVADERADVTHVDLDIVASERLTSRFNVLQTPTTLILDHRGAVLARISGAVRPQELRAELAALTPDAPTTTETP